MATPRESQFNPAYSTIKSITLSNKPSLEDNNDGGDPRSRLIALNITNQNSQCRFERLELVENVNDVLPLGSILVADRSDIVTYIGFTQIKYVLIEFFDKTIWLGQITSVSYNNNAASDTEETLVVIHFTNLYYQLVSSNTLSTLLGYKKPQVFQITDFVNNIKSSVFRLNGPNKGYNDPTLNYFLYKPLNPFNDREEAVSDGILEMMNYVATGALDDTGDPNFLFWTSFDGTVNFKSFKRDLTKDASYATIDQDYRNIAVFDGESVIQELTDRKKYRKCYFLSTNPAFQWISKNYYYIRKTPKYLDVLSPIFIDENLEGDALDAAIAEAEEIQTQRSIKNLAFHFQDDGEKYNIDVVSTLGRGTTAPAGGDNIVPEYSWGYYDGEQPTNNKSITALLGNNYGTNNSYRALSLMGLNGLMPYLDSPDMWKNMFNLTPIHPHYPDDNRLDTVNGISGSDTNLQKVIDIRYNVFMGWSGPSGHTTYIGLTSDRITQIRDIEKQNFVMYSLCCMGQKEDCFFALLQKYEEDNSYYGAAATTTPPTAPNGAKMYRYKWNKINFISGNSGSICGGCSGACAATNNGPTYPSHQLEHWCLDPYIKSGLTQDNTWAINLNERGLTGLYLPPGWVSTTTGTFKFRPIGAPANGNISSSSDIYHIVRLCLNQVDANNRLIYFWAENIFDGTC